MGLIAAIDNRASDKTLKKKNEIICVKLDHSPWSDLETKYFLRIAIDDAALEAQLQAEYDAGEPHPVAVHPYAEYVEENDESSSSSSAFDSGPNASTMINRSKYVFRRDLMSSATLALLGTTESAINDRETATPVLRKHATEGVNQDPQ